MSETRAFAIPTEASPVEQSYFVGGAVAIVGHLQGWMNGNLAMGHALTEEELFRYVASIIPALIEHPDLPAALRAELMAAREEAVVAEAGKRALAAMPEKVPLQFPTRD